jgi:hypothetical protein
LKPNDLIKTGPGQSAVVECAREGTHLELKEETQLSLSGWDQGKRYTLQHGKIEAIVGRQRAGESLRIATPQAEATVRGTRFRLSTQWDATWLAVLKGEVELYDRASDSTKRVVAEQFAVAGRDIELRAQPLCRNGLTARVAVEPFVADMGGDGDWEVDDNRVRQSKVSILPDLNSSGSHGINPFSWLTRRIPVAGNIEVSLQVRLDAALEEPGPLGYSELGCTLILDQKHLSFICVRDATGKGVAKLHSFVFGRSAAMRGSETSGRILSPLRSQIGETFRLKIRLVHLTSDQVRFQAKVWASHEEEPADWLLDAIRKAPVIPPRVSLNTRRCACTFTDLQVLLLQGE